MKLTAKDFLQAIRAFVLCSLIGQRNVIDFSARHLFAIFCVGRRSLKVAGRATSGIIEECICALKTRKEVTMYNARRIQFRSSSTTRCIHLEMIFFDDVQSDSTHTFLRLQCSTG